VSPEPVSPPPQRSPRLLHGLLLAGVVALFLFRASDGFVADHSTGDQRAYLGIAMKLDRFGLSEYNLYHISRSSIDGGLEYVWSAEREGELLQAYTSEGTGFYAQPVFHTPPLFPYLLMWSHRLFARDAGYGVLFPEAARQMAWMQRLEVQFYSTAVPIGFGVLLLVATFLLARMVLRSGMAVVAALLIAISPAVLFASEHLWQDVPVAALVTLTLVLLLRYLRSGEPAMLVLAAVMFGLALLTKNTAILLVPTIAAVFLYRAGRGGPVRKGLAVAGLRAGVFLVLVLILVFPWYYTAFRTWGTPFFNAGEEGISLVHPYWIFLKSRPWYTYLVSIPSMLPLYLLGFYRVVAVLRQRAPATEVIIAIAFLSFLVPLTIITHFSEQLGPDSRYMLPAYPPLAILTASQMLRLKDFLAARVPVAVARWAIAGAILICCAWSYMLTDLDYASFPRIFDNFMNMPF
jgi:hypothetical protein